MRVDQFVFRNLIYRPVTWIRGQNVFGYLGRLDKTQWLPADKIAAIQLERLQALLPTVRRDSPAYGRRLADSPRTIASLDDLHRIPTLSKQDLRSEKAELQSTNLPALCVSKTTGGSTGEPVTLLKTRYAMAWELAATWRGYSWAGIDIGDSQARFWGVAIDSKSRAKAQLIDFVCHRKRFSAFGFSRDSFPEYERRLKEFSPDWFYGYVSMVAEFARWYIESGRESPVQPRAVVTTSEVLSPDDRAAIATAFRTRVFNEYGCGELGTIAHECAEGRLHTSDENMIVEILDGERPCKPGEKGEMVITELNNTAMPLIRYRTGDFAAFAEEPCPCGRQLKVIDKLYGRAYDFILSPSGRKFHAEFLMYIFEEAQRHEIGIAQFQVRQTKIDTLEVLAVPSPGGFTPEAERSLVNRIRSLLGEDMTVNVTRVQRIERERSGKMRVIVGLPQA
ncbi:phenylacetate-CoA ligase [Povalibacter uvarum]|uniref:Phenylacetate-CoA ligase n=1 Tax=Povalibacter uvarum TaxID=732238 RepID=A0A841HHU9_9GAMM|nr:phenylacetate--CoA ligase family protein [Povalibacter uvarum]MBB6091645.1 phenylacetate-CoA ligase [Povalibacter uvarum]